ncbi:MAG: hypothetical protein ACKOB8_12450 [Mycobacterium sp.]
MTHFTVTVAIPADTPAHHLYGALSAALEPFKGSDRISMGHIAAGMQEDTTANRTPVSPPAGPPASDAGVSRR